METPAFVVGNVGQFRPDRSPIRLARIFIEVLKRVGSDVVILMVGGGSELSKARALIAEHGLTDRFFFTDEMPDPKVAMSAMDLYVTLNVGSLTGIAALEAIFTGVASLGLQLEERYQYGDTDWIWSSHDDEAVIEKTVYLSDNRDLLRALAEKQFAYATANFTAESMFKSYAREYLRLIEIN